jgi:hypothetical protein
MFLIEGGNVFKDRDGNILTQDIDQTDIKPTIIWLEELTGLPLQDNLLGSTGLKPQSGDIDVGVDKTQTPKSKLYAILSTWCQSHGLNPDDNISGGKSKDTAVDKAEQMSFKCPITGRSDRGYVQVDFMFEPDIEWARFAKRADPNTVYPDTAKHIVLNSVGKNTVSDEYPNGFTWSGQYGLLDRGTGQLVSKDPAEIAKLLFGAKGKPDDLRSVEKVLAASRRQKQADAIYQQMQGDIENANKGSLKHKPVTLPELKENDSPGWYRTMMGRLA